VTVVCVGVVLFSLPDLPK